jgi:hypothetical protein
LIRRLVLASLRRRARQLILIAAAVAVAAATVGTLAGFAGRVEVPLGKGLAAFGPNLTVRPQLGAPAEIPPATLDRVRAIAGVESATGVATSADARRFVRLEVRTAPGQLGVVAARIEAQIEGLEATPLLRVSESDARLTHRVALVLGAVSAISLALALVSVAAATFTLVGERRTEIGLMMALGYSGARIGWFLAAELLTAALLAAAIGALAGEVAAGVLATHLLGTATAGELSAQSGTLPVARALVTAGTIALTVVGGALLLAIRRLGHLDAAAILRGQA